MSNRRALPSDWHDTADGDGGPASYADIPPTRTP
jgi:hypothetical protein